jgi:hypothetical protein
MKGLLFSEFVAFAAAEFGGDVAEHLAPSDASTAWNPVGAYPHQELGALVQRLSGATGVAPSELLRRYGTRLFHRLVALYPGFMVGVRSAFPFLASFQAGIHEELCKLQPDCEMPDIDCVLSGDRLEMVYRSPRRLGDLAEGLLRGCIEHFRERIDVRREDLGDGSAQTVRFTLVRHAVSEVPAA